MTRGDALGQSDVHRVGSFEENDAWIFAKRPVDDAVAGIDGIDLRRTALEEAIGEAARAAAQIGADQPGDGQGESVEGVIEFLTRAGDE